MQNDSQIFNQYHNDYLKEHKRFLALLLNEEKTQEKLREAYKRTPKKRKKYRKKLEEKIKKRPLGRPRKSFEFNVAKSIVRSEGIRSVSQFQYWHKMNTPARMPRYPNRAYKKEWKGWGDFLGVYNEYTRRPGVTSNGKGKFRSLEEARQFARALNLNGFMEWLDYTRSGKCPMDIPHRPDMVYSRGNRKDLWISWKDFLGNNKKVIQLPTDKHAAVVPVIYVAKKPNAGINNVYIINVIPGGKPALVDHIKKMGWVLISAFYTDMEYDHNKIIKNLSNYMYGESDEYIINNVYELLSELDFNLQKVVF